MVIVFLSGGRMKNMENNITVNLIIDIAISSGNYIW